MSKIDGISQAASAFIDTGSLGKFIPEPRSRAGFNLKSLVQGVGSLASGATSSMGLNPIYTDLLQQQLQAQQEMQVVSMESNIEKSKHETQMAAIRNIRVG